MSSLEFQWRKRAHSSWNISILNLVKKTIKINQFRVLVESFPSYERFHPQLVWGFFTLLCVSLILVISTKCLHCYEMTNGLMMHCCHFILSYHTSRKFSLQLEAYVFTPFVQTFLLWNRAYINSEVNRTIRNGKPFWNKVYCLIQWQTT